MPFGNVAVLVGVVGVVSIVYGGVRRNKKTVMEQMMLSVRQNNQVAMVAISGLLLFSLSVILSQVYLSGSGWGIALYDAEGFYLGVLGAGMVLLAGLTLATRNKLGALLLTVGTLAVGVSLLSIETLSSDFSFRCAVEVGCSPILAGSTVTDMIELGGLLAIGAFLLGLGLSFALRRRKDVKP